MVTITQQADHQRADIAIGHHIVVDGVTLIRSTTGRYFAESKSHPGMLWLLTGFSCQCPGFVHRQTCRHHRALMQAQGWSRPESTPPPASLTCPACNGTGSVPATIATGPGKWAYGNETCPVCHGTGSAVDTAA